MTDRQRAEIESLRAQIAALLAVIEAKDAALTAERDLRILGQSPECGNIHWESIRGMRRKVYSQTEDALAISPSAELLEARDRNLIADFIHRFKRHVGGDGEFWLHELEDFAEALVAKLAKENKPVDVERAKSLYHPSFVPFKCPVCGSEYFGPLFAHGVYVGRYCKGRPSEFDRSYTPCRGKYEEMFEQGE